MPFAGEGEFFTPDSILSHCYGALLPMFTTEEATVLRLVCKEFKATVAEFPWRDVDTVIHGSVAAWRACFPMARSANINQEVWRQGRRTPILDSDFEYLRGLEWLDMTQCTSVTDAAFVHLRGISTLLMGRCSQVGITGRALSHLEGSIKSLDICHSSPNVSGAAFVHLRGIRELFMKFCRQDTICDASFEHLAGIVTLDMGGCNQPSITSEAFKHLKGIKHLTMWGCTQPTITDAAFTHLQGIHTLNMAECDQATITDQALFPLQGVHSLCLWGCTQLTSAALPLCRGIKWLNLMRTRLVLTDDSLNGVEWLCMHGCSQEQIDAVKARGIAVEEGFKGYFPSFRP
jgi:hypothetical protein